MSEAWNGRPPVTAEDGSFHWVDTKGTDGVTVARLSLSYKPSWLLPGTDDDYQLEGDLKTKDWSYIGPCLTPEQIEAKIVEAVKAERDACLKSCEATNKHSQVEHRVDAQFGIHLCVRAIRARGDTA